MSTSRSDRTRNDVMAIVLSGDSLSGTTCIYDNTKEQFRYVFVLRHLPSSLVFFPAFGTISTAAPEAPLS